MIRALALVMLLFVVGEATGTVEYLLGDSCSTGAAPCDETCPACVLCGCCSSHPPTSQPAARLPDDSKPGAFVSDAGRALPASPASTPPRQPPKPAQA